MHGYFDEPEETAATIDADGWLHTGDIGIMDDRGYVKITDRKKDMFIVGGFNAYPAEIENLLLRQRRDRARSRSSASPTSAWARSGMAFVVPRPGVDARSRRARSPGHASTWRTTRCRVVVEIVDELPLNASGKVLKYELRARAGTP